MGVSARTVYGAFRERLEAAPDEPFVSCASPWLTLAELDERSDRLAAGLRRLGVGRGDHLAWILPNRIETVEILIAVAKIGAVQIPLNYWLKGQFLEYQLSDCEAKFLIADGPGFEAASRLLANTGVAEVIHVNDAPPGATAYRDLLSDREQFEDVTEPGDLLTLMYTSGTTAAAKGCMLSTGYYVSVGRAYGLTSWAIPGDRLYTAFPMFHSSGQMVAFMSALVNGASIGIAPEFHATTFMRDAAAAGASALVGVGVMANMILAQPPSPDDAAHPFRLATWVPLPEDRQLDFEKRFGTPVMAEGYGQSECVPVTNTDPYSPRDRNSSGRPSPLLEVRIFDEDDREVPAGEARRDRRATQGAQCYVQRLLGKARRHRERVAQPVAPHRRLRTDGRRRHHHLRQPEEGHRPAAGRERLVARDRERDWPAPRGSRRGDMRAAGRDG